MKRQTISTLFAVVMFLLVLLCVSIRSQRGLYSVTDLGQGDSAEGYACAVNAGGQVAGYFQTPSGSLSGAFLYRDGRSERLSAAAAFCRAYGLNASGTAVGCVRGADGHSRACRFRDGSIQRLGTQSDTYSEAYAVNAQEQIVGSSFTSRGKHAFLYQDGHMRDLGTLGGVLSEAHAINDRGQIVGSSVTAGSGNHAYLYSEGRMLDLGTLGGINSFAFDVNEAGQIAGYADTANGQTHAFLYDNGVMQDLGTLSPGISSYAYGLNAQGEVVGCADTANGQTRAFVYKNRHMQDLNHLIPANSGWLLTEARAVNDKGRIAGVGIFHGQPRAFLLTPR